MSNIAYLTLNGMSKYFPGVKTLDHGNFIVHMGEVHALCGENGAGKSTLINIIAGNYYPDDGFIEIKGDRVSVKNYAEALNLGISIVYQETRKK